MSARRKGTVAGLIGLVVLVGLGWLLLRDDGAGAGARLTVAGQAQITTLDGTTELETGTRRLDAGETVTLVSGSATLFVDDTIVSLRDGSLGAAPTQLTFGDTSALIAGETLIEATRSFSLLAGGATITVDRGAASVHLENDLMTARSFTGRVGVVSGDARISAEALRSLSIGADGVIDRATPPLQYRADDPWDRRFLGDAIAFGDELERKAIGLVRNLSASTEVDADFLERVLPGLADDRDFRDSFVSGDRDSAELLVGASIASLGRNGDLPVRWEETFAFRDAGAHWGLVALDQGVNDQPALELIDLAIGTEELAFAPTPTVPPPPTTPPTVPDTTPPTTDPDPGTPGPPPTSPPTTPPPTQPSGPLDPVLGPVEELVDELLGNVLDELLGNDDEPGLLGGLLGG